MSRKVPVVGTCAAGARPEGEDEVTEVGEEGVDNRRARRDPAGAGLR